MEDGQAEAAKRKYSKEEIAELKANMEQITGEITSIQQNLGYRRRHAAEQKKEVESCMQKLKEENQKLEFQQNKMKTLQVKKSH